MARSLRIRGLVLNAFRHHGRNHTTLGKGDPPNRLVLNAFRHH